MDSRCRLLRRALPGGFLLFALLLASAAFARTDTVRVRLFALHDPTAVEVSAEGGPIGFYAGARPARPVLMPPHMPVRVQAGGTRIQVIWNPWAAFMKAVHLRTLPGGLLRIRVTGSDTSFDRRYRGSVEIRAEPEDGLLLINHVDLEHYVASVVTSEFPFPEAEGGKAQAVVTRTYALRARGRFHDRYDLEDHVGAQVYEGVARETRRSLAAAWATRGQVLLYRGELINAVYSSTCGGHTASNEEVWHGRPLPYLRGRKDPFDASAPHLDWRYEIPRALLHEMLSRAYDLPVTALDFSERTPEGRVLRVELLGPVVRPAAATETDKPSAHRIPASAFRLLVVRELGPGTLKSTLFNAWAEDDRYIFEGRGYGHGVGLCQWGAGEQARQGWDYRSILRFYYQGAELRTLPAGKPVLKNVRTGSRGR